MYDANYHRVFGYLLRRTVSREDAEDVLAETFLTAWAAPGGSARGVWRSTMALWVARNTLANHHRGERRRGRLAGRLHADVVSSSHPADADEEVAWVAAAFVRLSDDDRELLALATWEGLDPGEIATVLRCSRNAARIRLHRARRRLARELDDDDVEAARA
ncbi:MAG: RNA polymerase sigma factor, partial [Gaiellaceae bacterium]